GTSLLVVTLGPKGAAYVAAPGFDGWRPGAPRVTPSEAQATSADAWPLRSAQGDSKASTGQPVRSALVPAPRIDALDPTGCGDVCGAAACARLLAGDRVEAALAHATTLAARNAGLRGAAGLGRHLRGELLVP